MTTGFYIDLSLTVHKFVSIYVTMFSSFSQSFFVLRVTFKFVVTVYCMTFRLCMELEESSVVEVNNPGAYSTVCVDVELTSLAVNTIVEVGKKPMILLLPCQ